MTSTSVMFASLAALKDGELAEEFYVDARESPRPASRSACSEVSSLTAPSPVNDGYTITSADESNEEADTRCTVLQMALQLSEAAIRERDATVKQQSGVIDELRAELARLRARHASEQSDAAAALKERDAVAIHQAMEVEELRCSNERLQVCRGLTRERAADCLWS